MATKCGLITGYTTRRHLLLDLDDTTIDKAVKVVHMIMREWPEVGGCLIMRSSEKPSDTRVKYSWNNSPFMSRTGSHFHLVFDGQIGWNKAAHICETLAGLKILEKDYEKIRTFRGDLTLRVSPALMADGEKPAPVAVLSVPARNKEVWGGGIESYLTLLRAAN